MEGIRTRILIRRRSDIKMITQKALAY